MIDKFRRTTCSPPAACACPRIGSCAQGPRRSGIALPAFVKPMGESRSVGVTTTASWSSEEALRRQVAWIEREFHQPALVEDFLPGDEFTVLLVGNGDHRECLPGLVSVPSQHYGKHKVLRADLRGVGLTHISDPGPRGAEASALAAEAAVAMGCLDHVRIDVKTGADGLMRMMEVNGIPGLKPDKSWGPQLYTLHHHSPGGVDEDFRRLVEAVVDSAWPTLQSAASGPLHGLRPYVLTVRVNQSVMMACATWRRRARRVGHQSRQASRHSSACCIVVTRLRNIAAPFWARSSSVRGCRGPRW